MKVHTEEGFALVGTTSNARNAWAFSLFGIANLLTFSFLMTSMPLLQNRFGEKFGSYTNIVYGASSCIGQFVGIGLGTRLSFDFRIIACLSSLLVVSVAAGIILCFDSSTSIAYGMGMIFSLGLAGSVLQTSLSALAGLVSADAMAFLYIGQSISGLLPLPLMGLLRYGLPSGSDGSMFIAEMSVASLFLLGMIVIYRTKFAGSALNQETRSTPDLAAFARDFRSISSVAFDVFGICLVSFAIYPRDILKWSPTSFTSINAAVYQSLMLYAAIVFDVLGMLIPTWGLKASLRVVNVAAWLRAAWIPIFILTHTPLLAHDLERFALVVFMSTSGAFLFSSALENVFSLIGDADHDVVGYIVSFCFTTGMTAGGAVGHWIDIAVS